VLYGAVRLFSTNINVAAIGLKSRQCNFTQ